jgi:outer membrane lipoprotein-sorting protein
MKRSITFILITLAVTAIPGLSLAARANGKVDEILNKMQDAGRGIRTVTASLYQENKDSLIGGRPQTSSGTISFSHEGRNADKLRIDYTKPAGQTVAVIGDQIILVQGAIQQCTITSRAAQATKNQEFGFLATPYESAASLKSRYNIVYLGDEKVGGANTSILELTPRTPSSITKWTLWIDQSSWLPIKYRVHEGKSSTSTFTLSNLVKNGKIGADKFRINCPKGFKEVRP